jgi:hypothetical protein
MHFATNQVFEGRAGKAGAFEPAAVPRGEVLPKHRGGADHALERPRAAPPLPDAQSLLLEYAFFMLDQRARYCQ